MWKERGSQTVRRRERQKYSGKKTQTVIRGERERDKIDRQTNTERDKVADEKKEKMRKREI